MFNLACEVIIIVISNELKNCGI